MERKVYCQVLLVIFLVASVIGTVFSASPVAAQATAEGLKVTKIPVPWAWRLAVGEGSVWILNKDTVLRLDPTSHEIVATITGLPDVRDGSHISTGAGAVWVTCRNFLTRIDPTTNKIVARINMEKPYGVAVCQGAVWVTQDEKGLVLRVNPRTNQVAAKIQVGGEPGEIIGTDDAVWIIEHRDKEVVRIDPSANRIVARIELAQQSNGYRLASGGGAIWASRGGSPIYRIDPASNKITATFKGDYGNNLGYGGGGLWKIIRRGLQQINPENGEIVKTIEDQRFNTPDNFAIGHQAIWVPSEDRILKIGKIDTGPESIPIPPSKAIIGQVVINQIDISKFPDVILYVSVFDDAGNLVKGLQQQDFRVLEDEVDQSPLTLTAELPALAAVMVMDTSGSMRKALPQVQKAAASFVNNMRGEDQIQLILFAEQVNVAQPFTTDKAALEKAIRATQARGNTALYDAAFQAADSFGAMKGRKAIILLTDGKDDDGYNRPLSKKTVRDVGLHASEVNVPIYTIGLGTEVDTPVLHKIAADSGGRYFFSPTAAELEGLYRKIVAQLEGQYRISYTTNLTERDGSSHRVVVRAGQSFGDKSYKSPTQ